MLKEKKISKSGSITIPSYLRREMGIMAGERVKIVPNEEGNFILQRVAGSCMFCGTNEELKKVKGKFICKDCTEEILASKEEREKEEKK